MNVMKKSAIALAAVLVSALCHPARVVAQQTDAEKFQKFLLSDFHKQLASRALAAIPSSVFQRCPSLVSQGSKVVVLKPVVFAPDGFPNAGMWKEMFPVSGCGNDTVLNIYFVAGGDEKVNTTVAAPGTTHADLILQRNALTYVNTGAHSRATDCSHFDVKSTQFGGYGVADPFVNPPVPDPGPNDPHRPWWETWTMTGCGRTFDVPLAFLPIPDKPGTNIIQPLGSVVEKKN